MSDPRQRHPVEQACVVGAVLAATLVCVLSYLADRSYREAFAPGGQIDVLKGDLTGHWWVFGALSANEVHFERTDDGAVEVDVLADTSSWSDVSSGVGYAAGLFAPGWYEFAGELRADVDDSKGIGAQIELRSRRWRFIAKADSHREGKWKKFDVYFRPASSDPSAEISCRFLSAGGNRAQRAFLRNIRLVKITAKPPPEEAQYDLERKEEVRLEKPRHLRNASFRGAGATVLFLAMIVGLCWRLLE